MAKSIRLTQGQVVGTVICYKGNDGKDYFMENSLKRGGKNYGKLFVGNPNDGRKLAEGRFKVKMFVWVEKWKTKFKQ